MKHIAVAAVTLNGSWGGGGAILKHIAVAQSTSFEGGRAVAILTHIAVTLFDLEGARTVAILSYIVTRSTFFEGAEARTVAIQSMLL